MSSPCAASVQIPCTYSAHFRSTAPSQPAPDTAATRFDGRPRTPARPVLNDAGCRVEAPCADQTAGSRTRRNRRAVSALPVVFATTSN